MRVRMTRCIVLLVAVATALTGLSDAFPASAAVPDDEVLPPYANPSEREAIGCTGDPPTSPLAQATSDPVSGRQSADVEIVAPAQAGGSGPASACAQASFEAVHRVPEAATWVTYTVEAEIERLEYVAAADVHPAWRPHVGFAAGLCWHDCRYDVGVNLAGPGAAARYAMGERIALTFSWPYTNAGDEHRVTVRTQAWGQLDKAGMVDVGATVRVTGIRVAYDQRPGPPNVAAAVNDGAVRLNWGDSWSPLPVTGWRVYRDAVPVATLPPDARSFTDAALGPVHGRLYEVSATNGDGEGSLGYAWARDPVTVPETSVLTAAPVDDCIQLTAVGTGIGSGSHTVFRQVGAGQYAEHPVAANASVPVPAPWPIGEFTVGTSPVLAVDCAVTPGQRYSYYLVSKGKRADPDPIVRNPLVDFQEEYEVRSNEATAIAGRVPVNDTPGAPAGVVATATSPTTGRVRWDASPSPTPVLSYVVSWKSPTGGSGTLATPADVRSVDLPKLKPGTTYAVEVRARNGFGEGQAGTATFTTPAVPPAAPAYLNASSFYSSRRSRGVSLSWERVSDTGGAPITGYRVYRGTSPSALSRLVTVAGDTTVFDDTKTTPGVTYFYRVAAVNEAGEGPLSPEASAVGG